MRERFKKLIHSAELQKIGNDQPPLPIIALEKRTLKCRPVAAPVQARRHCEDVVNKAIVPG